MVNIKVADIKRAWNRVKSDQRADEVGILRTQWDNIAQSSKGRLASVITDEGMKAATNLAFRAALTPDEVFDMVQALNAVKSSTRQVAIVKNYEDVFSGSAHVFPLVVAACTSFRGWRGCGNQRMAVTIVDSIPLFETTCRFFSMAKGLVIRLGTAQSLFWSRVDCADADGCWPLVDGGEVTASGHIRIWWQGKKLYAHRVAYELAKGPIRIGVVRHSCDNPPCCRPSHLDDGTVAQNVADRDARHRRQPPVGSAHWSAKLSDTQVRELRALRGTGIRATAIAADFGVCPSTISNCWRERHYPVDSVSP